MGKIILSVVLCMWMTSCTLVRDLMRKGGTGSNGSSPEPAYVLDWLKTIGNSGCGVCIYASAADVSNDIYVVGTFEGTVNFNTDGGSDNRTSSSPDRDLFFSKFRNDGTYLWTETIVAPDMVSPSGVTVDSSGNIYLCGMFAGTCDFDPTGSVDNKTAAGDGDIFITKINANRTYGWTRTMGSSNQNYGKSVKCDSSGNVFLTGVFFGAVDFDSGAGTDIQTSHGGFEIFLTKISNNGNYCWTRIFGGADNDEVKGMTLDPSGNPVIAGSFYSTADFDPGAGVDNRLSAGSDDAFVTKIGSDGSYMWTKTFGGTFVDESEGVAVDLSGNILVNGYFYYTVDFDPGPGTVNVTGAAYMDAFVLKLDSAGNYVWVKYFSGNHDEFGDFITTDSHGGVISSGRFNDTVDFDSGSGLHRITSVADYNLPRLDAFINKINSDGSYSWTQTIGGADEKMAYSILVDPTDGIIASGFFVGACQFGVPSAPTNLTSSGNYDAYIMKFHYSE